MKEREVTDFEVSTFAEEVLKDLRGYTADGALVVALVGDLGAGKTTFTQSLLSLLGVSGSVTSPTFVIQKNYTVQDADFSNIVHIDAYRVDSPSELSVLGFSDVMKRDNTLIIVEWADRVEELLPEERYTIELKHVDEKTRKVRFGFRNEKS